MFSPETSHDEEAYPSSPWREAGRARRERHGGLARPAGCQGSGTQTEVRERTERSMASKSSWRRIGLVT